MCYFPRPTAPGTVQHLIARFSNGEFRIVGAVERDEYLRRTALVAPDTDRIPLAYGLMSSHIHWATLAGLDPPADFILPLHSAYARWLNIHQGRSGHVFMERFRLLIFEGETIADLVAYIHNNPVRAGVVGDPADSNWTSHRAYIGDVAAPRWLDVARGLSLAGFDSSPRGRLAFHEYVRSRAGLPRDPSLGGATLRSRRAEAREVLGSAVELGADVIGSSLPAAGVTQVPAADVLARPGAVIIGRWAGHALDLVVAVVAVTGISLETIRSTTRRRRVVAARRLALLTWTRFLGRRQSELLPVLGLSSSAGSQLLGAERTLAPLMADALALSEFLRARADQVSSLQQVTREKLRN